MAKLTSHVAFAYSACGDTVKLNSTESSFCGFEKSQVTMKTNSSESQFPSGAESALPRRYTLASPT